MNFCFLTCSGKSLLRTGITSVPVGSRGVGLAGRSNCNRPYLFQTRPSVSLQSASGWHTWCLHDRSGHVHVNGRRRRRCTDLNMCSRMQLAKHATPSIAVNLFAVSVNGIQRLLPKGECSELAFSSRRSSDLFLVSDYTHVHLFPVPDSTASEPS